MLVLSRKNGQSIEIGGRIRITVVRVQGRRVQIGIEAPRSDEIVRSELQVDEHIPGALRTSQEVTHGDRQ